VVATVDPSVDEPAVAVEWLSLAEAARREGVALDTMRRRVRRGLYPSRQVRTPRGLAWQVRLVRTEPPHGGPTVGTSLGNLDTTVDPSLDPTVEPTVDSAGLGELVHLVDRLQHEVVTRTEACAYWQGRASVLEARLQQLEAQLALPAPQQPQPVQDAQEGPFSRSDAQPASESSQSTRTRPGLWTRLRTALRG